MHDMPTGEAKSKSVQPLITTPGLSAEAIASRRVDARKDTGWARAGGATKKDIVGGCSE